MILIQIKEIFCPLKKTKESQNQKKKITYMLAICPLIPMYLIPIVP